jgi:hypothetical protein
MLLVPLWGPWHFFIEDLEGQALGGRHWAVVLVAQRERPF